jgi:hypothetical protein
MQLHVYLPNEPKRYSDTRVNPLIVQFAGMHDVLAEPSTPLRVLGGDLCRLFRYSRYPQTSEIGDLRKTRPGVGAASLSLASLPTQCLESSLLRTEATALGEVRTEFRPLGQGTTGKREAILSDAIGIRDGLTTASATGDALTRPALHCFRGPRARQSLHALRSHVGIVRTARSATQSPLASAHINPPTQVISPMA